MCSEYFNALTGATRLRYLEKINVISGQDPYTLSEFSRDIEDFPKIAYGDIINYLVFERSSYTMDEFKAYKSLDSYNQFLCGWVKGVAVKKINSLCVVIAKVLHSQKLNATPLAVWVIAKPNGQISSAHCNCVAGLGETCSHIGALLFAVDDNIRKLEVRSVTGMKAYWKVPSAGPGELAASKNIDYTSNKKIIENWKRRSGCLYSQQTNINISYCSLTRNKVSCTDFHIFVFFFLLNQSVLEPEPIVLIFETTLDIIFHDYRISKEI